MRKIKAELSLPKLCLFYFSYRQNMFSSWRPNTGQPTAQKEIL